MSSARFLQGPCRFIMPLEPNGIPQISTECPYGDAVNYLGERE